MQSSKVLIAMVMVGAMVPCAARAQQQSPEEDPIVKSIRDGSKHYRMIMTKSAADMNNEDWAFRPTPDVRSFGELIAHVVDSNYHFCAAAQGQKPPVLGVEKSAKSRDELRTILEASFDYCDTALRSVDPGAKATINFMSGMRSPMSLLNFRIYHGLLHYGNVIVYMRLRGKVPPTSQLGG